MAVGFLNSLVPVVLLDAGMGMGSGYEVWCSMYFRVGPYQFECMRRPRAWALLYPATELPLGSRSCHSQCPTESPVLWSHDIPASCHPIPAFSHWSVSKDMVSRLRHLAYFNHTVLEYFIRTWKDGARGRVSIQENFEFLLHANTQSPCLLVASVLRVFILCLSGSATLPCPPGLDTTEVGRKDRHTHGNHTVKWTRLFRKNPRTLETQSWTERRDIAYRQARRQDYYIQTTRRQCLWYKMGSRGLV